MLKSHYAPHSRLRLNAETVTAGEALLAGRYYCRLAERQVRSRLAELGDNLDAETTALADRLLAAAAE